MNDHDIKELLYEIGEVITGDADVKPEGENVSIVLSPEQAKELVWYLSMSTTRIENRHRVRGYWA